MAGTFRTYKQMSQSEAHHLARQLEIAESVADARHIADRLMAEQPNMALGMNFRHFLLWRVRRAKTPQGWSRLQDVLAPRDEDVKMAGRANDIGVARLYSARMLETAIAEMRPCEGEHYHAIAMMSRANEDVRLAIVGEQHHVIRTGYLKSVGIDPDSTVQRALMAQGYEAAQRIGCVDALLASVLADASADKKGYIATRAVVEILRHRCGSTDGIMFPSVQHELGTNYCIDPSSANRVLKVVLSIVVRIDRIWSNGYFSLSQTCAHVPDGAEGALRMSKNSPRKPVFFNVTATEMNRIAESFYPSNGASMV